MYVKRQRTRMEFVSTNDHFTVGCLQHKCPAHGTGNTVVLPQYGTNVPSFVIRQSEAETKLATLPHACHGIG
jgi:hypothetical protein